MLKNSDSLKQIKKIPIKKPAQQRIPNMVNFASENPRKEK